MTDQWHVDETTDLALVARRLQRPRLDWRSEHDPRSRDFRATAGVTRAPLQDVVWAPGPDVLDQGAEGACVGFALAGLLAAEPIRQADVDADLARSVYREAQTVDEVPGEDYVGTSVLAGLKVGQGRGWWSGYRWAFGTADVAQAVIRQGPVVVGVPWFDGMYATDPGGQVVVRGEQVGGHALVVVGFLLDHQGRGPTFVWLNSWGPEYGEDGVGYVSAADLGRLLAQRGEAAVVVR